MYTCRNAAKQIVALCCNSTIKHYGIMHVITSLVPLKFSSAVQDVKKTECTSLPWNLVGEF
jgi:hypothetical protein